MRIISRGKGPALVLLHGSPTAASYFEPVFEALQGEFQVLAPRFPGYDGQPASEPLTVSGQQHELERDLLALGIRRAGVLGYSAGAYRALHWALTEHELEIRGIYGLSALAGFDPPVAAAFAELGKALQTPGYDARPAWRGRALSPAFAKSHPEIAAATDAWIDEVPARVVGAELMAIASAPDLRPRVAELAIPVVARTGSEDVAAPPDAGRAVVHGVRNGSFELVPGCGHALLFEDRDATVASIVKWARSLSM